MRRSSEISGVSIMTSDRYLGSGRETHQTRTLMNAGARYSLGFVTFRNVPADTWY